MMRKMFLLAAFCSAVALQAQDYYVVTGENVNVRSQPVTGKVVGKVSSVNSFTGWDAGNGWVNFCLPSVAGSVSGKFLRKVEPGYFSRTLLGDYMGEAQSPVSYTIATLSEKEGYVVLQLTDFLEPDEESGLRGRMSHVYVGTPHLHGIHFTHYLYPYDADKPLAAQMGKESLLEKPYDFVVAEDNKLRAGDRVLELQEGAGQKDVPISERDLFLLKGKVKEVRYARTYSGEVLKSLDQEAGGNHPLRDLFKAFYFSSDGFLKAYEEVDADLKPMGHYVFTSGGDSVWVEGKRYGQAFYAAYTRETGFFGISYRGRYDAGQYGKGIIKWDYALNMNGVPFDIRYEGNTPPFVGFADCNGYHVTYRYGENPYLPVAMNLSLDYGGESWIYNDAEIRDVKTDLQGNWTERKVYVDGNLFFEEKQKIFYY